MENILIDFTQQLLQANHIPVHRMLPPFTSDDALQLDLGLRNTIFPAENQKEDANSWLASFLPNKIYHMTDDFQCSYTALRLPNSGELFVCGPVLFEEIKSARFSELCRKLNIPSALHDQLRDYYNHVAFFPGQTLYASIFTQLAGYLFGKDNYETIYTDYSAPNQDRLQYDYYYRIPDQPFLSIQIIKERYSLENAVLTAVANGNETKAIELSSGWFSRSRPQRLSNELRDGKDYAITFNTLLRKTTEQTGIHPIHIDCLSNRNIQLIEQLTSLEQCETFCQKMIRGYCSLVREHNLKDYSLLTQKIITYVDTHLCADLSLKSFSERLSVNASYLSTLFKKEMGVPLTDFVNHRRIAYAKKLLLSTDIPIKSVALQCGIPDVYYFSRMFKRITGTTPKVYRETTTYETAQKQAFPSSYHTHGPS